MDADTLKASATIATSNLQLPACLKSSELEKDKVVEEDEDGVVRVLLFSVLIRRRQVRIDPHVSLLNLNREITDNTSSNRDADFLFRLLRFLLPESYLFILMG